MNELDAFPLPAEAPNWLVRVHAYLVLAEGRARDPREAAFCCDLYKSLQFLRFLTPPLLAAALVDRVWPWKGVPEILAASPHMEYLVRETIVEALATSMIDSSETIDLPRDRRTKNSTARWLADQNNLDDAMTILIRVFTQAENIGNRLEALQFFVSVIFDSHEDTVAALVVSRHLHLIAVRLKVLAERAHVLTGNEQRFFRKLVSFIKDLAAVLQDNAEHGETIITTLLPHVLVAINNLTLLITSLHSNIVYETILCAIYTISNLAAASVRCQQLIGQCNPIPVLYKLLNDSTLCHAVWHTINWCILSDEAKLALIKIGGAERIAQELNKPKLATGNIIFCARKLAMLPETRKALINGGFVPFLLNYKARVRFQSSSLSFLRSNDSKNESPWKEKVDPARDVLMNTVQSLHLSATDIPLGVLYVEMDHCRFLLSSSELPSQCFGAWWVLHLLTGQHRNHYARAYHEMALRDRIVPSLFDLICKLSSKMGEFAGEEEAVKGGCFSEAELLLLRLCLQCLLVLSEYPEIRPRLVDEGVISMIPTLSRLRVNTLVKATLSSEEGGDGTVLLNAAHISPLRPRLERFIGRKALHNLFSDPDIYLPSAARSLVGCCERYICENTDRGDWALLVDFANLHCFYSIEMYFLSKLFTETSVTEEDIASCGDEESVTLVRSLRLLQHEHELDKIDFFILRLSNQDEVIAKDEIAASLEKAIAWNDANRVKMIVTRASMRSGVDRELMTLLQKALSAIMDN